MRASTGQTFLSILLSTILLSWVLVSPATAYAYEWVPLIDGDGVAVDMYNSGATLFNNILDIVYPNYGENLSKDLYGDITAVSGWNSASPGASVHHFCDIMGQLIPIGAVSAFFGGLGYVGAWSDARTCLIDYFRAPDLAMGDYCADPWAINAFGLQVGDTKVDWSKTKEGKAQSALYALRKEIADGHMTAAEFAKYTGYDLTTDPLRLKAVDTPIVEVKDIVGFANATARGRAKAVTSVASTTYTVYDTTKDGDIDGTDAYKIIRSTIDLGAQVTSNKWINSETAKHSEYVPFLQQTREQSSNPIIRGADQFEGMSGPEQAAYLWSWGKFAIDEGIRGKGYYDRASDAWLVEQRNNAQDTYDQMKALADAASAQGN